MKILKRLVDSINFVVSPPICILCSNLIDTNLNESEHICNWCYENLPPPLDSESILNKFEQNFPEIPNIFRYAFSLFNSQGDHRYLEIIHYLKYTKFKKIGYFLGKKLGEKINSETKANDLHIDLIVPVPIHKVRERERGFNQAEIISNAISYETDLPVASNLLIRKVYTQSQTQLGINERKKNVENAFVISKESTNLADKDILLVDDVVTTGSTLFNCAKVLKEKGASNLYLAVLTTA